MPDGKTLVKIINQKPWLITIFLAGLLVIVAGLTVAGTAWFKPASPSIEIITASSAPPAPAKILVDIGGAVKKPGLYEFSSDNRINDALVAAGGLADEADRDWVSQNLNLAKKLTDGEKIYVPFKGEASNQDNSLSGLQGQSLQVNINTASLSELDTLWGVGPVTAQKIIDNRPYAKIDDLLEKKIVKTNVFEAIKDKISVL